MSSKHTETTQHGSQGVSEMILSARLEIGGARDLHAQLIKCWEQGANVNVDAAHVEAIDTTALQLLAAFVRQVSASGNRVDWRSPSDALLKAAELTGLTKALGLPAANA